MSKYQIKPGDLENSNVHTIKILLDSGASTSIVCREVLDKRHHLIKKKKNKWSTMAGTFNTSYMTSLNLRLQELNHTAEIYAKRHLTDKLLNYDLILVRDMQHELGIGFNFENNAKYFKEISFPMKPPDCTAK